MREQDQASRAKRTKRQHRALQVATCLSVLVLSCSVYEPSLLSGRGTSLQGNDAAAGDLPDAVGGNLPGENGGATSSEGGHTAQAGERSQAQGGSPSGEAGSPDQETAGATVMVTYGGASANDGGAGGSAGAPSGRAGSGAGGASTGMAGMAGMVGAAGSAPVVRELAKSKKVTASTFETGNEAAKGNDGNTSTRWCAVSGAMPQWWRVDLGATYKITQVVLKLEHPDRKYTYVIETSPNDAVFTQQAMVNGTGDTQKIDMQDGVSARYVRVTVTAGASYTDSKGTVYPTWASFWELNVFGY